MEGKGGFETAIGNVTRGLLAAGHEVRLFLLGASTDPEWHAGLPTTVLGVGARRSRLNKATALASFPFAVRAFRPDAMIGATQFSTLVSARTVRLLQMKTRVASWMHFTLSKLNNVEQLRAANVNFAISSGIASEIREVVGPDKPVVILFNPINLDVPPVPRPDVPTFLHIGRLQVGNQKRTDDFLRALALLRGEFRAHIIGGGDDTTALQALAEELGIAARITWTGWTTAPWDCVDEASLTVLSSSFEGLPMILIESLARGIPVLSTDCPHGPADIVLPGENGWLVPLGDIAGIAARMQSVLDGGAALPPGKAVAATAARFGIDACVTTIETAFGAADPRSRK
jgi:UDP-D-galactose:(glucosyl)LPS alpha-1,6-D-galactosyltransferase